MTNKTHRLTHTDTHTHARAHTHTGPSLGCTHNLEVVGCDVADADAVVPQKARERMDGAAVLEVAQLHQQAVDTNPEKDTAMWRT